MLRRYTSNVFIYILIVGTLSAWIFINNSNAWRVRQGERGLPHPFLKIKHRCVVGRRIYAAIFALSNLPTQIFFCLNKYMSNRTNISTFSYNMLLPLIFNWNFRFSYHDTVLCFIKTFHIWYKRSGSYSFIWLRIYC